MAEPDRVAMLPALPQIVAPPWADDDGDEHGEGSEVEGPLKEVHETLANLMLLLVAGACRRRRPRLGPPPREPRPRHDHRRQARPGNRRHRLTLFPDHACPSWSDLAPPIPAGPFSS